MPKGKMMLEIQMLVAVSALSQSSASISSREAVLPGRSCEDRMPLGQLLEKLALPYKVQTLT